MSDDSNWKHPLPRRRAIIGAFGLGAGLSAAALVGCGQDKGDDSGSTSVLSEQEDTTKSAAPGGTYGSLISADVSNLDPLTTSVVATLNFGSHVYSKLFKWKPGILTPPTGEIEGDLVEGWELTDNNTRVTLKLRPNARTDPRPPLNGRAINSADVRFSFNKFLTFKGEAADLFNSKSASAPLLEVQTPDARTVVLKLAFPFAPIFPTLAEHLNMWVMPIESDGTFDPKSEAHGSGPWLLKQYQRSVGIEYERNPNWYVSGRPFFDGVSQPIISEYAAQLAQFKAGRIWSGVVRQEDIVVTRADHPQLNLFQEEYGTSSAHLYFGWNGAFKDARLRQAASMLIDRPLFADTFSGSKPLVDAGLPKSIELNSHLGVGWGPFWANPEGKELGDGSRFFKHDIAEAKKLVAAAGYANGLESTFYTLQGSSYGTSWHNQMEVLLGMLAEGGLKFTLKLEDYQTVYLPKYHYSKGNFDGMSASPGGARADPGQFLNIFYHSEGSATRIPGRQDKDLDDLIDRQLRELDRDKRRQLIIDVQRHLAENMIAVPYGYQSKPFSLAWPWVANAGVYRGRPGGSQALEVLPFLWYDASKANR